MPSPGAYDASAYLKNNLVKFLQAGLTKEAKRQGSLTNTAIYNACKISMVNLSRSYRGQAGSTANFSMVIKDKLYFVNTGDSRAMVILPTGVRQITEDAKPGKETYERSIAKRGGNVVRKDKDASPRVDGALSVARSVGDHYLDGHISARPKITQVDLCRMLPATAPAGTSVTCHIFHGCDGVFDVASSQQVGKPIRQGLAENKPPLQLVIDAVISSYKSRSSDNLSAMLVPVTYTIT
ncbi:MAG: PP2C family serine/threonine-protein phosphatase [Janthinobacterium lividum]